jgi:hypothetical protein
MVTSLLLCFALNFFCAPQFFRNAGFWVQKKHFLLNAGVRVPTVLEVIAAEFYRIWI